MRMRKKIDSIQRNKIDVVLPCLGELLDIQSPFLKVIMTYLLIQIMELMLISSNKGITARTPPETEAVR